jgi:Na+/proline symporter
MLAGFVAGFLLGLILSAFGKVDGLEIYAQLAGVIAGIPVGIWVIKTILTKEFSSFRIVLAPSSEALMEKAARESNA